MGLHFNFIAIQAKEHIGGKEGHPLVPVNKWMIHNQGFEKGRSHFHQIMVISRSGAIERTFEQTEVPNSANTSEPIDQRLMNGQHFVDRKKLNDFIGQGVSPVPHFHPGNV